MVPLLCEDETQPCNVIRIELPITTGGSSRVNETLAFEKADF